MCNDRYSLSREQNMFLAKKLTKQTIYFGARLGDANVTFPRTETPLNGVNVGEVSLDDIQIVLNLRDGWKYLLNSVDEVLNIDYICKINSLVSRNESLEWGVLRKGNVSISGTDYVPPIPNKETAENELSDILSDSSLSDTEKASKLFLWEAKSQLFWDGNKRTALLAANKFLIQHGRGIFSINDSKMQDFSIMLSDFYTYGDYGKAVDFICTRCLLGIDFPTEANG